jgi:hypothetical protein
MNRAENIFEFRRANMHGNKGEPGYADKYHPGGKGNADIQGSDGTTQGGDKRITSPPVREDGTIRLHHWSRRKDLKELDPGYHGTGIEGAESFRKEQAPHLWVDRTYFGIAPGRNGGYIKEPGLGIHKYIVDIPADRLYDIEGDPLNLQEMASFRIGSGYVGQWLSAYESEVADAGYAGYWIDAGENMGLTAVVYELTIPRSEP